MTLTWRERIAAAKARGCFTRADKRMAGNWATCAVGEQAEAQPLVVRFELDRIHLGPEDGILFRLGGVCGFYAAVLDDQFVLAETLLDAIEDRTVVLKREQGT